MSAFNDENDNEEISFENNIKNELQLMHALGGLKPVGISKHLQMICVVEKLQDNLSRKVKTSTIWEYLNKLYDLDYLNEIEVLPANNKRDYDISQEPDFAEMFSSELKRRKLTHDVSESTSDQMDTSAKEGHSSTPRKPSLVKASDIQISQPPKESRSAAKTPKDILKKEASSGQNKSRSATPIIAKKVRNDSTSSAASNISSSTPRGRSSTPKRRSSTPKERETKRTSKGRSLNLKNVDDDSKSKSSDELVTPVRRALRKTRGSEASSPIPNVSSSRKKSNSPLTTPASTSKRRSRF